MWIKSEEGKLYNSDGAHCIEIEDRGGGMFVVVIEYSPVELRLFNLTRRIAPDRAQRVMDEIEEAIERGAALLNLCKDGGA